MLTRHDDLIPPAPRSNLARLKRLSTKGRIALAVIALVAIVGVLAVGEWMYLGTWPLAAYPERLEYCGFSYTRQGEDEITQPVHRAFVFSAPMVASRYVYSDLRRGLHVGDTPQCANFLYIKSGGPHRYQVYEVDQRG